MIERVERHSLKHAPIVLARNRISHSLTRTNFVVQTGFLIEDGAVQLFLGGEVAKDHRFRHVRRPGDLFRGRTAKAALGKEAHGNAENLQPAFLAGHPRVRMGRMAGRGIWCASHLCRSKYSLTILKQSKSSVALETLWADGFAGRSKSAG